MCYEVVINIFAKISQATMNDAISKTALDLLVGGPLSQNRMSIDKITDKTFGDLCLILTNLLKSNRTIVLRNSIAKQFTLKYALERAIKASKKYVERLNDDNDRFRPKIQTIAENYMGVFMDIKKDPFTLEGYEFHTSVFDEDVRITKDELIEEAMRCFYSIFDLVDLLYFSIFSCDISQETQLNDLNSSFLEPLNKFLQTKGNQSFKNSQIILSKALPYLLTIISGYLKFTSKKEDDSEDLQKLNSESMANLSKTRRFVNMYSKKGALILESGECYEFKESLKELEDKILPEDVLRAAHGGVIESIFYRDTDFPGENRYWMEQYQFLETQKNDLKAFTDKYDDKYEKEWLPQYYKTVNCSTVWYNSVQKFVSCKVAKEFIEEDYLAAAQKMFDSMMKGNTDSIAMLHFTFFCAKEKYNIYPIIYTYKIHAEVLTIAAKNITAERKRLGEYFSSDEHVKLINRKILNLYDNEEMISSIFKLL